MPYRDAYPSIALESSIAPDKTEYEIVRAALQGFRGLAWAGSTEQSREDFPFPEVEPHPDYLASHGIGLSYSYGQPDSLVTQFGRFELPLVHLPDGGKEINERGSVDYAVQDDNGLTVIRTGLVRAQLTEEVEFEIDGPYREVTQIGIDGAGIIVVSACVLLDSEAQGFRELAQARHDLWMEFAATKRW